MGRKKWRQQQGSPCARLPKWKSPKKHNNWKEFPDRGAKNNINERNGIPKGANLEEPGATRSSQLLPVLEHQESILKAVRRNRVTIIQGDTGSGKTTQIP